MAQSCIDGKFLKWGLTLRGMVIHILQKGYQIIRMSLTYFPNPRGQPLSFVLPQPEPRQQVLMLFPVRLYPL